MAPSSHNPYSPHGAVSLAEKRGGRIPDEDTVPDGTISEIEEWVGDDPQRAVKALAAEEARDNPRKGITEGHVAVLAGDAIPEGMTIEDTETWVDEADSEEEKFLRAIRAVEFELRQDDPRVGIVDGRLGGLVVELQEAVAALGDGEGAGSPGEASNGDSGGSDPGDG